MDITKDSLKTMIQFLEDGINQIKEEPAKQSYTKALEATKTAFTLVADNEEKAAWLNYVLANTCYQVSSYLYRYNGSLDKEFEKRYFALPLPSEALEYARSFEAADNAIKEKIMKDVMEVDNRRAGIDIFKGVLAGDSLETAKQKQADFEARMNQAMGVNTEKPKEA